MTTYNWEKYLEQQLGSIIPQLQPEDELIISDDGSTDGTLDILGLLRGTNIYIFRNSFKSPTLNFQFALRQSSQPLVCFSDQDDIWLPNKRQCICDNLQGTQRKLIMMNAEIIDGKGTATGQSTFEKWRVHAGYGKNLMRNTFMGSSMAFTADLKSIILPFPDDIAMHDWWIGLMAERTATVERISEKTLQYRVHGNNASLQGSSLSQKIRWRYIMHSAVRQRLQEMKGK